jgi:hypothetical protein
MEILVRLVDTGCGKIELMDEIPGLTAEPGIGIAIVEMIKQTGGGIDDRRRRDCHGSPGIRRWGRGRRWGPGKRFEISSPAIIRKRFEYFTDLPGIVGRVILLVGFEG